MTCSTLPRELSPCSFKNLSLISKPSAGLIQSQPKSSGAGELLSGSGVVRHVRGTGSPRYNALTQKQGGVGMTRSQLVAEHLPLLRRYARALTGNQSSGDAYVGAMLEALLQDSSLLD